ncbi:MAG TPA: hypothetical protein VK610_06595, partial [Rhodothermales bacterium]|nr:hypothetical protein [Rhodothermales bacterium]
MSAFDQTPAPDAPSTDAFEAAMAARGGYDEASPDGGAGGDGAASAHAPDWSVYQTDGEATEGAFDEAFDGAHDGVRDGAPEGAYDVVAAYREAYPGTAASTPEGVMEEVRSHFARQNDERALYGRFDALLEDPATEAFLAARLAGYSAEEAAQAADLQDWGPDPEQDPHGYAEWYARRAVSQVEQARHFEAWRAEEDYHAWQQEQAEVMGEEFLMAERLTDADRA